MKYQKLQTLEIEHDQKFQALTIFPNHSRNVRSRNFHKILPNIATTARNIQKFQDPERFPENTSRNRKRRG